MNSRSLLTVMMLLATPLAAQLTDMTGPSLYSDIKAHNVGDVVTILIVETANASRESRVERSSQSDVSASGSVTGNLTNFLPLFGASSSLSSSHDGSEGTQQKEQLTGKISASIVEKTENGLLRIQGERLLEVNGELNLMRLEGLVRPRDIRSDNTVYSYNIAEAKIVYKKGGLTNKLVKPGTVQRWSTWFFGAGLLALAILGTSGS
jgi:flagellar L-ring protein precursor FlgH